MTGGVAILQLLNFASHEETILDVIGVGQPREGPLDGTFVHANCCDELLRPVSTKLHILPLPFELCRISDHSKWHFVRDLLDPATCLLLAKVEFGKSGSISKVLLASSQ